MAKIFSQETKKQKANKGTKKNDRKQGKDTLASVKQQKRAGIRHQKLGKNLKQKLQRKWKRKKYNKLRQRQKEKIKPSKIIHIHIRQPSQINMFPLKRKKTLKTKQRMKTHRGWAMKLFLEK